MTTIDIKAPDTQTELAPLIRKRWSPRSFSDRPVSTEQVKNLLEAARWAASANNEQPWRYTFAIKGTPGFEQLWNCLAPGNQPWTKDAAVLLVAMKRNTFQKNGKPNPWAEHDLGLANAQLLLQAAHRDIYGHMMAGFDKDKVNDLLSLDETVEPVCMMALGYLGEAEALEEPYKTRELTPRTRLPIEEFSQHL
jgi:nitroreductase